MKANILFLLSILLLMVGIYSLIDIISSINNVISYEKFTWQSSGVVFGKVIFLLIIVLAWIITRKTYKKIKS